MKTLIEIIEITLLKYLEKYERKNLFQLKNNKKSIILSNKKYGTQRKRVIDNQGFKKRSEDFVTRNMS